MSFAQELGTYVNWVGHANFAQNKGDLLLAIASSDCPAHALVLNLHRVSRHAATQLFYTLATALNSLNVDRRPAPQMEPQFIVSQLSTLMQVRVRKGNRPEPVIAPQLGQEFQSFTTKILSEYTAKMIASRDGDR
ncbi:uncharacterized protein Z519_00516 [Cladophialophora bantiana CBS 173.52]|uniref:Uncharacterized protein n=1 Tax=Cladophialophora bantiana (strain ATCC 10958 / CBS 173.52 / CDC B-1940 / NIH 8579) TaxID=1442370 RepID=A0A0D2HZG2_CLAB1|nr:uncharacterized protein Z519_00516 [Cladophialophora bantiana CBS 173.52]KIW98853.1 hypothetical protein Z519_00516 [Cladophialophora bantiana CBS 173.52]